MFKLSEKDYIDWCNMKNKKPYDINVKKEFFEKLINKKIYKNKDGKLIEEK